MRKYFTVIIFACAVSHSAWAQRKQIDSLQKLLPSLHNTERIDCLNELGKCYCNRFDDSHYSRTDSAELFVNKAYAEAVTLHYKLGIAKAVINFAQINDKRYNFIIAQNYAEKAISLLKEIKNEPLLNQAYLTLADVLWYEGEINREQNYLEIALQYYEKVKDTSNESVVLDWLSECYIWKGNFEKGYEYLQDHTTLVKNLSSPEDVLDALNRKQALYYLAGWEDSAASYAPKIIAYKEKMGIDTEASISKGFEYFIQHKWDSAQYYNKQIHNLIESDNRIDSFIKTRQIFRNDIDIASIYQREGKYKEALPIFMKALKYDKERNFVWGELEVLLNISQVYQLEGKNNDAIYYGQYLLSLAQKTQANYYILNASKLLWEVCDKKKDSAMAYKYYLKYTAVKDSTINGTYQRKLAVISELTKEKEQQTQITALDKDNKLQEATIQKNILVRNILLSGVLILILLAVIIYRVVNLKRKNEKFKSTALQHSLELERIQSEKKQSELQSKASELEMQALRSQMNPHFIFNCLSSINRFILKNRTEEASDYLIKFSRLIRMVLNNSKQTFISLEDELETLRLYLDMERLRFKNSFDYSFIYKNSVETGNIFIPPLLLQPFAENAIWHGLMNKREKGFLQFDFCAEENFLLCVITDNGVGREQAKLLKSKSAEIRKSIGLEITTERLRLLNNNSSGQTFFTIEDLIDKNGKASGTKVQLKIFYKQLAEV